MNFSQKSSIDISDSTHPLTDDSLPQVDYLHPDITTKYFVHFTSKKDTLPGLALFYKTTVEAIKQSNRIINDQFIHTRQYLLIPKTPHNLHLEQAIGTVIYPDMEKPPDEDLDTFDDAPIEAPLPIVPNVHSYEWNGITPLEKPKGYATSQTSYLEKLESTILSWYVSPTKSKKD